VRRPG